MKLYKSFPQYSVSDHKPVVGKFVFKTFSDYVDRIVEFEIIHEWRIDQENVVGFSTDDDSLSDWDWIGLYKVSFSLKEKKLELFWVIINLFNSQADFSSIDEYVSFVYLNQVKPTASATNESSSESGRTRKIHFPDSLIRTPGKYCLLYVTADSGSILGISNTFEAKSFGPSSFHT